MLVPVIGLVGGISSGKSSIARWASSRHNLIIIEADQIGHAILTLPSVKKQLYLRFGNSIFDQHQDVDRSALGRVVFGCGPLQKRARADLESIVHPEIRGRIKEEIDKAKQIPDVDAVVLDAAVLFEAGWDHLCDAVVFVDVPDSQRLERAIDSRGWDKAELELRESSQLSLESKRQRTQYTIDNSGTLADAGIAFARIVSHIKNGLT